MKTDKQLKKNDFTEKTVVADAIKTDPTVVDRLAGLDPHFKKLRNPVLRKIMARLVTLEDAAKIAGVPIEAVVATANGRDPVKNVTVKNEAEPALAAPPDWISEVDDSRVTRFDARPMLARGEEPFAEIMRLTKPLQSGDLFIIDAPFDPAPLRRVLGRKGFAAFGRKISDDHWQVVFVKEHAAGKDADSSPQKSGEAQARIWHDSGIPHIDVRGLEAPQPMLSILRLIEDRDTGNTIIVHHEREPLFLYPELDERGWRHEIIEHGAEELVLQLTRGDR